MKPFSTIAARLTGFEKTILLALASSAAASGFIWLFYMLLKIVTSLSSTALGSPAVGDLSLAALAAENTYMIPVVVVLGALAGSLLIYFFDPEAEGGGTEAVVHAYHFRGGLMKTRTALVKAIASAVFLGTGSSAGPEGPSIQIGGSAASSISRILGFSIEDRKVAIVAGMAAALAFVFQAPMGSAVLAAEVLYMRDFAVEALVPAIFASVLSYTVSIHLLGPEHKLPPLPLENVYKLYTPIAIATYIGLGVFMAPFSLLYVKLFNTVRRTFTSLTAHGLPSWLRPVIGAAVVGSIGVTVPHVLGTGEELLAKMLEAMRTGGLGAPEVAGGVVVTALILAVLKIVATSVSVGSGGAGGLLAPGLFAGAMVGLAYGLLVGRLAGLEPVLYAYLGMAALFGAASKVSMGLSIFVAEIAETPFIIVPNMITAFTASTILGRTSLIESQLFQRLPPLLYTAENLLRLARRIGVCIPIGELQYRRLPVIDPRERLSNALKLMLSQRLRLLPVVDRNGVLIGILDPGYIGLDIEKALESQEPVAEYARLQPPRVEPGDCIDKALEAMVIHTTDYVIVVEGQKYLGILTLEDIAAVLTPWLASGSRIVKRF